MPVLHRVVAVHLQIALGGELQPQAAVKGQGSEHVVEKADAGVNLHHPAIQA